ncbi:PqiB family protein [Sphingomonas nostoxanthinifaciens]|uniref:PqiB family protein n=1 Tax=Sphingomonas nostoxanthinifaciens TaxID=2872652 RepID=UPI001CC1E044|nr:MlaD family protein [Sphingomonas nostoxanthinifaciens]UAK24286.1 MlaD family protein [Sphingomonas nostoxanthinifaciens]
MNDDDRDDTLPQARAIRSRWPGLVWAIPLAALIIVAYLGVRALTRRGLETVVTFGYVEGVTPGDTKVLMKGVEVGHVSHVRAAPDAHHVEVTLSLDPRVRDALNSNTKFWLVGEFPTITDIQSIRAAVAGVLIDMAPGTGGTPTRHFVGLDQPPLILPGTQGTIYYLDAAALGSIQPGAAVLYRGFTIGKVVRTALRGPGNFRLKVFVNAPFDRLIDEGGAFWTGSPLKLSLSGASLTAGLSSPASVLQGSVQYELPPAPVAAQHAPANTVFTLYQDQATARAGAIGPEVPYRVMLKGAAGDIEPGSSVTMLGYTVGRVRSAHLTFAPGGRPYTEATILLYPRRLDVALPPGAGTQDWRAASDRAVGRLLAQGYRAHMIQSPPLVGAHAILLAADAGARPARLATGGGDPIIPAAESNATADDLMAKADSILTKVDQIPLQEIGANVRRLTANVANITGSGEVRDGIAHLDATLRQLDAITAQVKPQIGPLMTKLNQTVTELQGTAAAARTVLSGEGAAQDRSLPEAIGQMDQAARSIRSLTDYLGRHPEALLRGKAKEK